MARYIATKFFVYDGHDYYRGAVWEPKGFATDRALISGRFVVEEEVPEEEPEAEEAEELPPPPPAETRRRGRPLGSDR